MGEIKGNRIALEKACGYCNSVFVAYKITTLFCSHRCSSRAYKQRKREERVVSQKSVSVIIAESKIKSIENKEYLSPTEVAILLGVGRTTIYRHLKDNNIEVLQTKGRTRIRREQIECIFGKSNQHRAAPIKRDVITELYTLKEIVELYNVSENWIYKIAKRDKIPKSLKFGKVYFSKSHIDKAFLQKTTYTDITEWYSVEEIAKEYSLSKSNIYSCASEHQIPRRKEGKMVYYSKLHFDIAQGKVEQLKEEYYTIEEAIEHFKRSRDALYHYIKKNNITKIKEGRYIKVSKNELDKLFKNQIKL